jgi:DNA-binding beta-propeller fold protein YncE
VGRARLGFGVALVLGGLLAAPSGAAGADVYVADHNGGARSLLQYTIAGNRTLAPKAPPSVPVDVGVDGYASDIAVSPDGRHAYVVGVVLVPGVGYPGVVLGYRIAADGTLSPNGTADAGLRSRGIAIHPDGRSAYVTNQGDGNVSQFTIASDGKLTPKNPATIGAGTDPEAVAVTPDGDDLYVTNHGGRDVNQYAIARSGKLTKQRSPTQNAGESPVGIAVNPDGGSAYVANAFSNNVSQYTIADNGELRPMTPPAVSAGQRPTRIAVAPDGRSAYVANSETPGGISQYTISKSGALTPITPPIVRSSGHAWGIAVAPDGGSVYATTETQLVNQYTVAADGGLIGNGAATASTNPRAIAAGTGPAPSSSRQFRLGKLRRNKRRGTARLHVKVRDRGKLSMSGRGVRRVTKRPRRARKLTLRVAPRSKLKRRLVRTGAARTRLAVGFDPKAGERAVKHRRVKLVRAR